ncbi:MAG: bifunctional oligoribonuclease/PAP phosphatase NrnA [Bacteroidetes bacterium]|nr:bifunctional oligoribonuclease/PAP phosphatase NrnA [Bacteroidota bacterium]
MKPLSDLYPLLSAPRKVVITTHQKPDADAMGSMLGLKLFLEKLGHAVTAVSPTNWAGWVSWMPGAKQVVDFEQHKEWVANTISEADWLFCLDFNIFHRTKHLAESLAQANCTKILIDHHQQPDTPSFQFGISDTAKSSTCELIYDFIVGSGNAERIDGDLAACLYAGVVGDTGSFRFDSATAAVHRMVADLKDRGLDHGRVYEGLYDNYLENRLRFMGHVLSNRMEVFYEYNAALIAIPKSDLLRFQIRTGDTDGLVNIPHSIQGIRLVALCIDRDEERKWSFRSKGDFDCNQFARKHFEGGGHFHAAGGRSSDTLNGTVEFFKNILPQYRAELNKTNT